MSNLFVCLMGMGTVFVGLICIIIICIIMGMVFRIFGKSSAEAPAAPAPTPAATAQPIQNKQEIVAAACVAIAEELGEDVRNIRVVSFKRV